MKQRLLTLAAAVGALGAGAALFFNWESATVEQTIPDTGSWEQVDKSSCTVTPCVGSNTRCTAAQNHLDDAGSACSPRFVDCDFRVSTRMRTCFADAGMPVSAAKYQRVRLIALRCPGADGGVAFGVPFDDAGCPIDAEEAVTPRCVRAPLDGGLNCQRRLEDGGLRFFGTGNVMPIDAGVGAQCESVNCSVFYGDNPDTDL